MREINPYSSPDDTAAQVVTVGALRAITEHWRAYNAMPANERLGDEDSWDAILPEVLVDVGIGHEQARELCAIAKLNAQF